MPVSSGVSAGPPMVYRNVVKYVSDMSQWNPAAKIANQYERIANSERGLARGIRNAWQNAEDRWVGARNRAHAYRNDVFSTSENMKRAQILQTGGRQRLLTAAMINPQVAEAAQGGGTSFGDMIMGALVGSAFGRGGAKAAEQAAGAAEQVAQQNMGPFQNPRTVTATSAPGALLGRFLGGRGGQAMGDLATGAGLLPEALGGKAGLAILGIFGAGLALAGFTSSVVSASKALGTVESVKLDMAMFSLHKQTTLLMAELGQGLIPVLRGMAWLLRQITIGLRAIMPGRLGDVGDRTPYFDAEGRMHIGGQVDRVAEGYELATKYGGFRVGKPPDMATGGIIPARPGGTLARIGEAGEAEAVVPMSKLGQMMAGGISTWSSQKQLADAFQTALVSANDLPPLWQRLVPEPQPAEVAPAVIDEQSSIISVDALTFLAQSVFDKLTGAAQAGFYAIYRDPPAMAMEPASGSGTPPPPGAGEGEDGGEDEGEDEG